MAEDFVCVRTGLMLSSCWAWVPFVPKESWVLTAAWLGPGRLPVVCSVSIMSWLLQQRGRHTGCQRGSQQSQMSKYRQLSKIYLFMRACNSTVPPAGSLTPFWPFLGSTHYQNFSESKVRLRTHWWHINIRLEDMGILAGDRRGFNL